MGLFSNTCMSFFYWFCCIGVITDMPPPGTSTPMTLGDGALGSRSPPGVCLVHILVSCPVGGRGGHQKRSPTTFHTHIACMTILGSPLEHDTSP